MVEQLGLVSNSKNHMFTDEAWRCLGGCFEIANAPQPHITFAGKILGC